MKTSILTCLLAFFSCDKGNEPGINNSFEVTVAAEIVDCGLILIDFAEKDKNRIEEITSLSGWLRYYGFNLDQKFNQRGQKLLVKVRKTTDEELFVCTKLAPTYP